MRTQLVVGNWKLNNLRAETESLIDGLRAKLDRATGVDVAVAPPFPYLALAHEKLKGSPITLAAQNVHWEAAGAFTGEVSPAMLRDVGCEWVIIGHSERRQFFGETDQTVFKRIVAAVAHGLNPIVCVGETAEERDQGKTLKVVQSQIFGAAKGLDQHQLDRLVFAYEPVWAIGTGRVATPEQAQEVHAFIRESISQAGKELAERIRILYGGSVKGDNAAELLAQPDIDGALVGGASLKAEEFARIVLSARGAKAGA